jgi:hypothetical protein
MAQTLYALRRDLRVLVVLGTTTLQLNPEAIETDVTGSRPLSRADAEVT